MKKVKITGLQLPDNTSVYTDRLLYKINLGNGIVKRFENKAAAQKFLNEVSKFLTYKMHECNELYIAVFTMYRKAWFYFDHDKPAGRDRDDLYAKDRMCESNIQQIAESFTILYRRANWANGNHFVFVHFNNIIANLLQIMEALYYVYENKSATAIHYEIEILTVKINYCKRTIDNYTVELENSFKEQEQTRLTVAHSA